MGLAEAVGDRRVIFKMPDANNASTAAASIFDQAPVAAAPSIDIPLESCLNHIQGHDATAGRMGPAPCTGCTARVCTRGAPTRGLVGFMTLSQEGGVLHWARFALVKTLPPGGWARHSAIRALSGHYGFRPKTWPMLTCGRNHN